MSMLNEEGFVDSFAELFPTARGRATCWVRRSWSRRPPVPDPKTCASRRAPLKVTRGCAHTPQEQYTNRRYENEGNRIDYILVSKGLWAAARPNSVQPLARFSSPDYPPLSVSIHALLDDLHIMTTAVSAAQYSAGRADWESEEAALAAATAGGAYAPAPFDGGGLDKQTPRAVLDTQFEGGRSGIRCAGRLVPLTLTAEVITMCQHVCFSPLCRYMPPHYSDHIAVTLELELPQASGGGTGSLRKASRVVAQSCVCAVAPSFRDPPPPRAGGAARSQERQGDARIAAAQADEEPQELLCAEGGGVRGGGWSVCAAGEEPGCGRRIVFRRCWTLGGRGQVRLCDGSRSGPDRSRGRERCRRCRRGSCGWSAVWGRSRSATGAADSGGSRHQRRSLPGTTSAGGTSSWRREAQGG